jgi:hypothetical protein
MKKVNGKGALLFLVFVTLAFRSIAQTEETGWVVLAKKTVAYQAETDKVNMWAKSQNLSKIKLKCIQGTVKLRNIRVEMSDGTGKEFHPKGIGVLTKGMSSFAFDLPGKDLKLKSLEIDYDSAGNMVVSKRAKVEIWGKKRAE